MGSKLTFIYDGECPFCNQFAELIDLKSNLPDIEIKNARDKPKEIPNGYDMDVNGAILIKDGKFLYGEDAIHIICSEIQTPSDALLKMLSIIFSSKQRTRLTFPILITGRRILLFLKGIPRKLG